MLRAQHHELGREARIQTRLFVVRVAELRGQAVGSLL